jgi:hypothetical protein
MGGVLFYGLVLRFGMGAVSVSVLVGVKETPGGAGG